MPLLCGSTVYFLAAVNKASNGTAVARRAQLGYVRREFIIKQSQKGGGEGCGAQRLCVPKLAGFAELITEIASCSASLF